jgi:RAQPRD family integrative conjugative element protein
MLILTALFVALMALPTSAIDPSSSNSASPSAPDILLIDPPSAGEQAALARIELELTALRTQVAASRESADGAHRYTFDYDALLLDLERVQAGVREYRFEVIHAVREITSIGGAYTR